MPIARRQFELGIDHQLEEYMRRIYDLLQAHEDEAYSAEEVGAKLGLTESCLADWLGGAPGRRGTSRRPTDGFREAGQRASPRGSD